MSRADDIADAQREVDAMLPDTPPIAPALPPAAPERVEACADVPNLRGRFPWDYVLSSLFALLSVATLTGAMLASYRSTDVVRDRVHEVDFELRILRTRLNKLDMGIVRINGQIDDLARKAAERQGAAEKPRTRR